MLSVAEIAAGNSGKGKVARGELDSDAIIVDRLVICSFKDQNQDRATLVIENVAHGGTTAVEVRRMYPKGAQIELKEPQRQGNISVVLTGYPSTKISVANPSLLKIVRYFPERTMKIFECMDAAQLRKQGNVEFGKRNYEAAAELYTMSLNKATDDKEALVLGFSNRAQCWLGLGIWESAVADAREALSMDPAHAKSLLRAGKALLETQEYILAFEVLKKARGLEPGNKAVESALMKSQEFLYQSTTGDYAKYLEEYFMGGSKWEEAKECSEYLGPVEVRLTPDGKGRGLFAVQGIKAGKLIMVSKPLAMSREDGGSVIPDVVAKLVRLCMRSKEHLCQLYSLAETHGCEKSEVPSMLLYGPNKTVRRNAEDNKKQEELEIDVERIKRIVNVTSYSQKVISHHGAKDFYTALLLVPGFINNSCVPNMSKLEVGDASFFHACRDINAGEELTTHYGDMHLPWATYRRKMFQEDYMFRCRCKRCQVEEAYNDKLKHAIDVWQRFGVRVIDANDAAVVKALAKLAPEIELAIKDASEEEKSFIRTSCIRAYVYYYRLLDKGNGVFLSGKVPSAEVLAQSLRSCAPGDVNTILFLAQLEGGVRASDFWMITGSDSGNPRVLKELVRQVETRTGIAWLHGFRE